MKSDRDTNLVWIDLEMTGIDSRIHRITEAALVITNKDLEILEESEPFVIWQPQEELDKMDDYVKKLHEASGVLPLIAQSQLHERDVEEKLLEMTRRHVNLKKSPLCGNSIYVDRTFLLAYMPEFNEYVHYRNIDVSTLKELYKLWQPGKPLFQKKHSHEALDDIRESIKELQFYREEFIISLY